MGWGCAQNSNHLWVRCRHVFRDGFRGNLRTVISLQIAQHIAKPSLRLLPDLNSGVKGFGGNQEWKGLFQF